MFYKKIEPHLDKSPFIKDYDKLISADESGICFAGLNRSAKSLLLARAFQQSKKNLIVICSDNKLAEEYTDDLELLVGIDNVRFFPDFEVLPFEERSPHYSIRAQRIETLSHIISASSGIYTLSIRALLRKMVHPEIFSKNIIELIRNREYNLDFLISSLVGMGYESEFQVSKIGSFARRGGILDVFSPGTWKPIRIEFFGDEIESIRVFSISSQRSTGEYLNRFTLLPSREFSLHDINTSEKMWEKIHNNGFYEGIEQDISLLIDRISNLIDYFNPDNCILFWDEFQYVKQTALEIIEETTEFHLKARSVKKARILPYPENLFENYRFVKRINKKYQNFYLSSSFQEFKNIGKTIEAPFKVQENLHGNLDLLEQDLKMKLSQDYMVFIQSDNSSQSKRMIDLLPQFQDKIHFSLGVLQKGFILEDARIAVYTDHEIFSRYKRKRTKARFSKDEALVDYESLKPGDYIVHIDHGIGIYAGLKNLTIDGNIIECLLLKYAGSDSVYVPTYQLNLVSKFVSEEGVVPTIHRLGSRKWATAKSRARKQIELVAQDVVDLYAQRKVKRGISFEEDTLWQCEMEDSFIYEDTPDQSKTSREIKDDMEQDTPMERLLCGDVGFGKTEVAIRAAFKAVMSGWQVAVLVPTTLLAEQHFIVFRERLAQYPVTIAMFSRFRSRIALLKDVDRVSQGEIDIVIGTHRLLSKDINFKKLGLLIIDEEHRFGVRHKDRLRVLKANIDTLYMSATPIPRTMYMALSKLKELSLIRTSPKERLPIRTVIVQFDKDVIKDAITREHDRGGQVFFVHNRVQTIDSITRELRELLPNISFVIAHGQLPEKILEKITLDFAHHEFDVLVTTTIIESGIDIPNVNTIIVNRADMFGLAQLYQIRGRVGRSSRRAYAYLIIPPKLTEQARKRLETLIEYESLGSGYQIAMRDMELRGVGALLGTKQSGIINTIGFNYYNRLLENAIKNIQNQQPAFSSIDDKNDERHRLQVESDFYFPENYIADDRKRLNVYRSMLNFSTEDEFLLLEKDLTDRFGKIPEKALNAIYYFRLNMLIKKTSMNSFKIKSGIAALEFDNKQLPSRYNIKKLVGHFSYPVEFRSIGSLVIKFDLNSKRNLPALYQIRTGIEIVNFVMKMENGSVIDEGKV